MIIAVNARLKKDEQPEGYADFMFEMLEHLSVQYPQHQFLYIFNKHYNKKSSFPKNILPVIAGRQHKHP